MAILEINGNESDVALAKEFYSPGAPQDFSVEVQWEAIPHSDSYFLLSDKDSAPVNELLIEGLRLLVPADLQESHRMHYFPSSTYETIARQLQESLPGVVAGPEGYEVVLSDPKESGWRKLPNGIHEFVFHLMLRSPRTREEMPWEIVVSRNGVRYVAQVGISCSCRSALAV